MGETVAFRVWRGEPEGGELRDYDVEVNEGEVVLDVIHRIQATQAPDLAVRWNCKAGKCGSCSAEINGRPRLMCMTRMSTFEPGQAVTVTPLRTFPVIRDLVTDVSFNYVKAREIPAFSPPADLTPGEYRMQQVDVARSQEFRKCIECFLCQNVCHVIRDHEENKPAFAGPRYFIRIAELEMHPLDTADRRQAAQDDFGLGMCNITKCCTEVCPEHITITDNGIIPMKERVVDLRFDPVVRVADQSGRRSRMTRPRGKRPSELAAAERAARERLAGTPRDHRARAALADALLAQGRFAEAAAEAAVVAGPAARSRAARFAAHSRHAWALLCALEAGQLDDDAAYDRAGHAVAQAQLADSNGRRLTGAHALHALVSGDLSLAERLAAESLSWHRSAVEHADDELTLAHVHALRGDAQAAAEAYSRSRASWPENPRLPTVLAAVRRAEAPVAGRRVPVGTAGS